MRKHPFVVAALGAPLVLAFHFVRQEPERPPLAVTYLANEGFLVRSGESAFLIDAFLAELYSIYAALSSEALEGLFAREGPFAAVDLCLASHAHLDHFQPEPAAKYLRNADGVPFVSSPQVVDALRTAWKGELPERIRSVWPKGEDAARVAEGGIEVEIVELAHAGSASSSIQNAAHFVSLAGWKILHVGDAEADAEAFRRAGISKREVDVAFLPYWYFLGAEGAKVVADHVRARHVVAVHVPPEHLETTAEALAVNHPEVLLFRECMQTKEL